MRPATKLVKITSHGRTTLRYVSHALLTVQKRQSLHEVLWKDLDVLYPKGPESARLYQVIERRTQPLKDDAKEFLIMHECLVHEYVQIVSRVG